MHVSQLRIRKIGKKMRLLFLKFHGKGAGDLQNIPSAD